MPQGVLPLLTPTLDRGVLATALETVVKVGALPSQALLTSLGPTPVSPKPGATFIATSAAALQTVVLARFFARSTSHRVVVLFTDDETARFDRARVASVLAAAKVRLLVVRVGGERDRLWRSIDGKVKLDPGYRPATGSAGLVAALARQLGGAQYTPGEIGEVAGHVRRAVRSSTRASIGRTETAIALGPYAALAGLALAALILAPVLPMPRAIPSGVSRSKGRA